MWTPWAFKQTGYNEARASGPVFTGHFILTEHPLDLPEEFSALSFGQAQLFIGPELRRAKYKSPSVEVILLGVAVDSEGVFIDAARLQDLGARFESAAGLADYLEMAAGRYIFFVRDATTARAYLDPTAMLGLVYNPKTRVVASLAAMTEPGPIQPRLHCPLTDTAMYPKGGRFAFGYTSSVDVIRPLANHYLDLGSFTTHRHWPRPDTVFECATQIELSEIAQKVSRRHTEIITALAQNMPCAIPISGGQDSRLLAAFSKSCASEIKLYYTHVTNHNTRVDAEIANDVAEVLGIENTVFQLKNEIRNFGHLDMPNIRRRELLRQGYVLERTNPVLSPLAKHEIAARSLVPKGSHVMRGHVTDITKAVLWRYIGINSFNRSPDDIVDAQIAAKLMQLIPDDEDGPANLDHVALKYKEWLDTLPPSAQRRSIDFMGVEQYRTHSLGNSFYGFEDNFYMSPGNDRQIIELLTRPNPELRQVLHLQDMLLDTVDPRLKSIRYTRAPDNELPKKRKRINLFFRDKPATQDE